jgi:hypothetical protein
VLYLTICKRAAPPLRRSHAARPCALGLPLATCRSLCECAAGWGARDGEIEIYLADGLGTMPVLLKNEKEQKKRGRKIKKGNEKDKKTCRFIFLIFDLSQFIV